ncbi:enoyl-ACP reductase FabI [Acidocella aminolytica]|uniref:Enoyl-[acyl-carrier-protein] reductase [NADH] n=1 Tax=Acidocella aminolytica 101 = DSM 11237 TaxID=1120923 RepID=A0A0D6PJJ4_9PROT|nr:enoyl-ACP reductase FabI [Acidocella aminolytica]GAN81348.1 enoyl-(acyl carrier protein) reductase [Acidocella aminolytica 101 = DSM 11237]GBQ33617.1 enoyl-[acyl-carrier-protein] reductase [Acidocella aminolytica 101 = DSM 11237]SHF42703.1 Enoyl-[acyl-carrier-protein] reductase [NADH] [Acidocella aminolytica 101 = DSM 11237]
MSISTLPGSLAGKRGLVIGIANEHSIAAGCARAFAQAGAVLTATYLNEKARPFVTTITDALPCDILMPCDVQAEGQLEAVFEAITQRWGKLDFVLHSIAFAPAADLHSRVVDCSAQGFATAMDVSCHSFLRTAKLAEPLMVAGGTLLAMTYIGSERVIPHYGIMGPVKAALESCVRYTAVELGPKKIRVNAISPGPIATRAASGIEHFSDLLDTAAREAPEKELVKIEDCGDLAAFLVSDAARMLTGTIIPIDGGEHLLGA